MNAPNFVGGFVLGTGATAWIAGQSDWRFWLLLAPFCVGWIVYDDFKRDKHVKDLIKVSKLVSIEIGSNDSIELRGRLLGALLYQWEIIEKLEGKKESPK